MWKKLPAEQREFQAEQRKAAASILRASLRERIDFLDQKPDRTEADIKLANQLAKQHNRSLMRD
jgi:hypothetical protein